MIVSNTHKLIFSKWGSRNFYGGYKENYKEIFLRKKPYMIHIIMWYICSSYRINSIYSTRFLFSLIFFNFLFFNFALLSVLSFIFSKVRGNDYNLPPLNPIMHKGPFHCHNVPTNKQKNIFQSKSFFYIMLILKKIRLRWKRTHPVHVVLGKKWR